MSDDMKISLFLITIITLFLGTLFSCQANDNYTAVKLKEAGMADKYIDCVLTANRSCPNDKN